MTRRPNRVAQSAVGALLALAAVVWALTSGTRGGWTSAQVANDASSARSGLVSIDHSYGSSTCSGSPTATTPRCTASLYPATVPATGTATRTDAITNSGTVAGSNLTARARVAACAPVQLANSVGGSTSGPMLPRSGTTFAPSTGPASGFGSIALDGTSGYASSVTASVATSGPIVIGTANYGLGIWFRTTSTTPGALFGLGTDPLDAIGVNNDRVLYLDGAGRIGFNAATGLGNILSVGTAAGVPGYNDGTWHFAYVAMTVVKVAAGLTSTVTLLVDGKQVSQKVIVGLVSYLGYWHVGWSPVSGVGRYFAGSLSGFTIDESGNAPTAAAATTNPTSYTSFDPTRTAQWRMDDSGGAFDGTSASGVLPAGTTLPGNAAAPCSSVDLAWTLTGPAATVTASTPISALVSAGWSSVAASPDPGATQTSTITVRRDPTFSTYSTGLILYAPIQLEYSIGGTWPITFTWDAPAPNAAAGSTFVIGAS